MEKHFELTDETIEVAGNTMHRIRCTRDCKWAKTGDLGGFIEKEDNLSGNAWVSGDARVSGNDDHCGFDVFGSIGRHTHAYRTSDGGVEITCGCFHGDIEAFEAKVRHTHGDSQYAREYLAIAHVIRVKFGLA
jgi:hypothetical protein